MVKMEAGDIPQRSSSTKVDEGNSRFAQAGLSHRLHQETEGDATLHVKIRRGWNLHNGNDVSKEACLPLRPQTYVVERRAHEARRTVVLLYNPKPAAGGRRNGSVARAVLGCLGGVTHSGWHLSQGNGVRKTAALPSPRRYAVYLDRVNSIVGWTLWCRRRGRGGELTRLVRHQPHALSDSQPRGK